MNFVASIEAKRDGKTLSGDSIKGIINEYSAGSIPDYQMAAFLMAIYFRGLSTEETRALTEAMRDSGEKLQFPADDRPLVDKHSTGGVGDKVSLPLAPLLACLGFRVPMISGRGLGITGGTLDKLESIPGVRTLLSTEEIEAQVQSIGCVICGQTAQMVPADKSMYALRDVTGTVPSIPLITASILSKKLAEGITALLLDVKTGAAAFMQNLEQAQELAHAMVSLGNACGVQTRALITNMDQPLGNAAGNWLEVKEAVEVLEGRGPEDTTQLVVECAAHLSAQCGTEISKARAKAEKCLRSGAPRVKWEEMLRAQGADIEAMNGMLGANTIARFVVDLKAEGTGFVRKCDARILGEVIRDLGGGRLSKDARVDHRVGIDRLVKVGRRVERGSPLCRIHATDEGLLPNAIARIKQAFEVGAEPSPAPPLIHEVVID